MTDWFAKMESLKPNSIAPYPRDRPPVWVSLAMIGVAVAGAWAFVAGLAFALWGWW
jgi:hypothetical protein